MQLSSTQGAVFSSMLGHTQTTYTYVDYAHARIFSDPSI